MLRRRAQRLDSSTAARILVTTSATPLRSSCCQMRTTVQPKARSSALTCASRRMLPDSFSCQNAAFVLGFVACSGQPCQKQPSMKTATLFEGNTTSGLPGSRARRRYRNPAAHSAFLRRSSGPVSRSLTRDMHRRRCSGVRTSVIVHLVHPAPRSPAPIARALRCCQRVHRRPEPRRSRHR
jgi:hypothetical protein